MKVGARIARIRAACASPLGYAMRGVTSWDQQKLDDWEGQPELHPADYARLLEIEAQVFGSVEHDAA